MRKFGFVCRIAFLTALGLSCARIAIAQPDAPCSGPAADEAPGAVALPSLDVISVKPSKAGDNMVRFEYTSDGLRLTNVSLHIMLTANRQMNEDQIIGEPSWAKSDRFDIEGKVAESDVAKLANLSLEQHSGLVMQVLADRFAMKTHTESRELPVYNLVVAKGGSKLKESSKPKPDAADPCAYIKPWFEVGRASMTFKSVNIPLFLHFLSEQLGRTIVDKTGLTGRYDFTLTWTPDEGTGGILGAAPRPGGPAPSDQTGPSVFTAIEEQLGLKLEFGKSPIDVMVIDHIEKPAEN